VLFEPESLSGNPPPRREAGKGVARPVAAGSPRGSGYRNDADTAENLIVGAVTSKWAKGTGGPSGDECQNLIAHSLRAEDFDASEDGTGRGTPLVASETGPGWWSEGVSALRADPGGMPAQL